MFDIGDLLTLSNGKNYIFLCDLLLDGEKYVYLISEDGVSDFLICSLESDNLSVVTDGDLLVELSNRFSERLKDVKYE